MSNSIRPEIELARTFQSQKKQIQEAIERVMDSGWYVLGNEVAMFEHEFAQYHCVSDAVGVGSGTDALELTLRALGVGHGDIVFTVSHTAVATVAAIELTGAVPVFIDVDRRSYTMDVDALSSAVSEEYHGDKKAIIPVHLYGHPADMERILEIAEHHDLYVIEDCSQAHGASISGKKVGTWGIAGAFSFYPTKNLGVPGDGGAVITNSKNLSEELRLYRQYGWKNKYISIRKGMNTRLDELHAAILRFRLPLLDATNEKRREIATQYRTRLNEVDLLCPNEPIDILHAYHQFVVRVSFRDKIRSYLSSQSIETQIHYPVPIHCQPAYRGRIIGHDRLPITEKISKEILSLPISPQMAAHQVDRVCDVLKKGLSEFIKDGV